MPNKCCEEAVRNRSVMIDWVRVTGYISTRLISYRLMRHWTTLLTLTIKIIAAMFAVASRRILNTSICGASSASFLPIRCMSSIPSTMKVRYHIMRMQTFNGTTLWYKVYIREYYIGEGISINTKDIYAFILATEWHQTLVN